jgi:hypothetical protein
LISFNTTLGSANRQNVKVPTLADYLPGESTDEYARRLHDEMLRARGAAIQAYGTVEQALNGLCAELLGTDRDASAVLFFQINSWQRNRAIGLLLAKKFGSEFDGYWYGLPGQPGRPKTSGLFALIRGLDETRNQIVHWTASVNLTGPDDHGRLLREDALQPPNIWSTTSELRQLKVSDLNEFVGKASFVARSITQFSIYRKMSSDARNPWHEIFRKPCTYPPLGSHPLVCAPEGPGSQSRLSGE